MKSAGRKLAAPVLLVIGWILYGFAVGGAHMPGSDPAGAEGLPLGDVYFMILGGVGLLAILLYLALSAVSVGLERDSLAKRLLITAASLPIILVAGFSAFIIFGFAQQNISSVLSTLSFCGCVITALYAWRVGTRAYLDEQSRV